MRFVGKNRTFRIWLELVRGFNPQWLDQPLVRYVGTVPHLNTNGGQPIPEPNVPIDRIPIVY